MTIHKSISDDGGAIGDEITQVRGNLFPKITPDNQADGLVIHRKFYIANSNAVAIVDMVLEAVTAYPFTSIIFESSGDAQVVGDLTGSETNESPITVTIPATGHKSFWLKMTVPVGSTETISDDVIHLKITDRS